MAAIQSQGGEDVTSIAVLASLPNTCLSFKMSFLPKPIPGAGFRPLPGRNDSVIAAREWPLSSYREVKAQRTVQGDGVTALPPHSVTVRSRHHSCRSAFHGAGFRPLHGRNDNVIAAREWPLSSYKEVKAQRAGQAGRINRTPAAFSHNSLEMPFLPKCLPWRWIPATPWPE